MTTRRASGDHSEAGGASCELSTPRRVDSGNCGLHGDLRPRCLTPGASKWHTTGVRCSECSLASILPLLLLGCGSAPRAATPESRGPGVAQAPAAQPSEEEAASASSPEAPARGLSYFVGTWAGEFRGTEAFSQLEIATDGRFTFEIQAGPKPEQRCELAGALSLRGDVLEMTVDEGAPPCSRWGEAELGRQKLLRSDSSSFEVGKLEHLHAVEVGEDGKLRGPVWAFERKNAVAR